MRAIFLADAHLRQPQDQNYRKMLSFLEQQRDLDGLFLLGDIFEFWLGYRHLAFTNYIPLLEQLRRLRMSGTRLFFVEGNHDFNLGPYFSDTLECTIIRDQQMIDWGGQKLLLCHGDLLLNDPGYQRLRAFWRSRLVRMLARIIHPDPVWEFGIWLSNKGRRHQGQDQRWDPSPLLLPFASQQFAAGADLVFCGHFHHPLLHEEQGRHLVAVGDWISQFSYAELLDGRISLHSYNS